MDMSGFLEDEKLMYVWNIKCVTPRLTGSKQLCKRIHEENQSDSISQYPQKKSGLCKYRTGQCDYYDECMGGNRV